MSIKKICLAVAVVLGALMLTISGCTAEYSDDLFNEEVLKHYNLSGLCKPNNTNNENYRYNGDNKNTSHSYKCDLEAYEDFYDYVTDVFNYLNNGNYTVARLLRVKTVGSLEIFRDYKDLLELEETDILSDYCETKNYDEYTRYNYSFYFTTRKLGKYESEYYGQKMNNACNINISFNERSEAAADENDFCMTVKYCNDYDAYVITDEKYLKGLKNPYINV